MKGETSWKEELREVIHEGITMSHSEEEFIAYLKTSYGVEITRNGKDFSYLHPQKKKAIRGERLGSNYTKSEVLRKIGEQNNRQKSTANSRGRRGNHNGQSRTDRTQFGGGQSLKDNAGWLISKGIDAIEREMQQLDKAAELASRGLDAASEELEREQQRSREELDEQSRERDEKARNNGESTGNDENGNGSGSSNSYGKGD